MDMLEKYGSKIKKKILIKKDKFIRLVNKDKKSAIKSMREMV